MTDSVEEVLGPPGTTEEVASAICAEILSQSRPDARGRLGKLLLEALSRRVGTNVLQVALPVDGPGLMTFDRFSELCLALGEAYDVAVAVEKVGVGKYTFAIATVGEAHGAGDEAEWLGKLPREQFGGILDLIFQSVIMAAVGTVTSMGVQDAVRAAGGERRLARLMRHYRKAKAAGHLGRAERIKGRVTRSASRIKGRQVSWDEVESLVGPTGPAPVA